MAWLLVLGSGCTCQNWEGGKGSFAQNLRKRDLSSVVWPGPRRWPLKLLFAGSLVAFVLLLSLSVCWDINFEVHIGRAFPSADGL